MSKTNIHKYYNTPILVDTNELLPRDWELKKLDEFLKKKGLVHLYNEEDGEGKTSLVAAYIAKYNHEYKRVLWITQFNRDIKKDLVRHPSLLNELSVFLGPNSSEEAIFKSCYDALLRTSEHPQLLIVDDMRKGALEVLFSLITSTSWRAILIGKEPLKGAPRFKLPPLSKSVIVNHFLNKNSHLMSEGKQTASDIVVLFNYHLLTTDVLSKSTSYLEHSGFQLSKALSLFGGEMFDKKGRERIETQIGLLYDWCEFGRNEKWLLQQMLYILPVLHNVEELRSWIKPELYGQEERFHDLLEGLAQQGWLIRGAGEGEYKMHRLVQRALLNRFDILPQNIAGVLISFCDSIRPNDKVVPWQQLKWIPYVQHLLAHVTPMSFVHLEALKQMLYVLLDKVASKYPADDRMSEAEFDRLILKELESTYSLLEKKLGPQHTWSANVYGKLSELLNT